MPHPVGGGATGPQVQRCPTSLRSALPLRIGHSGSLRAAPGPVGPPLSYGIVLLWPLPLPLQHCEGHVFMALIRPYVPGLISGEPIFRSAAEPLSQCGCSTHWPPSPLPGRPASSQEWGLAAAISRCGQVRCGMPLIKDLATLGEQQKG